MVLSVVLELEDALVTSDSDVFPVLEDDVDSVVPQSCSRDVHFRIQLGVGDPLSSLKQTTGMTCGGPFS